jgi:hypothetical protein
MSGQEQPPPPYSSEDTKPQPVDLPTSPRTNPISSGQSNKVHVLISNPPRNPVSFNVSRTKNLKHVLRKYCEREGLVWGQIRFLYDGELIVDEDVIDDLMEDDERNDTTFKFEIQVFSPQTGGYFQSF